jgi:pimeloyl-ACP methyl ester carboxylesterase
MSCLLILHGWGSSAKNWAQVKDALEKKGYNVFLPDLPGFGESVLPTKPWSLDDYVDWLADFCEKNNLSQVFLLGHSFGGAIAAKFALKHPEKIKKLFLVASSGIRKKTLKKRLFKKFSFLFRRILILKKVFYKFFIKSDYQNTSGIIREIYLKIIAEDISGIFSQIKIPTVIIWGDKDKVTPFSDACFINQEIKNSKLEILPGIGHKVRLEAFDLLIDKIINHLNLDN